MIMPVIVLIELVTTAGMTIFQNYLPVPFPEFLKPISLKFPKE